MKVESGKWKVESGKWKMENGEWRAESLLLPSRTCHFHAFVILSEAKYPLRLSS
ncbi:MAG: hypothetical protein WBC65_10590 [Ignavibacteria bacterium]